MASEKDDMFEKIIGLPFMKNRTNMDDALDLVPVVQEHKQVAIREDGDDYQTSRQEIHDAMGSLKTAIGEMSGLAFQAQHSRAYEVLGQLIEKQVTTALALVDLQNKVQADGPQTINNTLMISSSEMLNMMKDRKKDIDG